MLSVKNYILDFLHSAGEIYFACGKNMTGETYGSGGMACWKTASGRSSRAGGIWNGEKLNFNNGKGFDNLQRWIAAAIRRAGIVARPEQAGRYIGCRPLSFEISARTFLRLSILKTDFFVGIQKV